MNKYILKAPGYAAMLLSLVTVAVAAEDAAPASGEKKAKPAATYTVARGGTNKIQLDAVLEAAAMKPVALDLKAWTDLTVLEAVSHGARVKKGDVLVKFDTEKLSDQIEELELSDPASKLALELATAELQNLEHTTPLKLASAQRSRRRADEDYDYFQKTDRAQKEKTVGFLLKGAEQRLRNANEELTQLKKMYDADDLTEETEEIILERQKFAVESAQHYLESAKLNAERDMKTNIPREHESLKAGKMEQDLALELSEQSLPKTLHQKKLALEKLKRDQKKSDKKLGELKTDLASLKVTAPIDGLVYYGACEQGKWPAAAAVSKKLIPGGKVAPREIFMTVLEPKELVLRAVIPEDKLSQFKIGQEGKASPISAPDQKLPVKVTDIDAIPLPTGGFGALISVENPPDSRLMPGMSCKISFNQKHDDSLMIPKTAVVEDGEERLVYVAAASGGHEKRKIKTGETEGSQIVVLQGLAEGDKILLEKPE